MPESNSSTEDPRYAIGRLGRPHGLNGYIGLYADDADASYFEPGREVFLDDDLHRIRAVRRAERGFQIQFEGIDTREHAEEIRGRMVSATERRELGEDEFWPDQLVGLEVRDESGERIGQIAALVTGGPQDRLVIEYGETRFEVPFVRDLVPTVDVESGYVTVVVIPGLIAP